MRCIAEGSPRDSRSFEELTFKMTGPVRYIIKFEGESLVWLDNHPGQAVPEDYERTSFLWKD